MDALSVASLEVYKPLVEIALSFNMEVELLHVSNQKIHTDIDPKVAEYIKGNGVACSYTKASSEDIFEGIVTHMNERERQPYLCDGSTAWLVLESLSLKYK